MPILILKLKDRELSRIPISKVETTIGRDPESDLVIDNAGVSRTHAVVRYEGGAFVVQDQGSENGIFVNGEPLPSHALVDKDEVQIGKFTVIFSTMGGIAPERLIPSLDAIREGSKKRLHSPLKTTHLSSEDMQKVLASLGKKPPTEQSEAPTMRVDRAVLAAEKVEMENKARLFRRLAIALGLGLVAMAGVAVWLLFFNS